MKIYVVGYGIEGIRQLTLESLEILKNCKKVFALGKKSQLDALNKLEFKNFEIINHLYRDGGRDIDNYNRIVSYLVDSLSNFNEIALTIPGHPRFGVTMCSLLESISKEKNFQLHVMPGISSFATMINDLKIDPLERGSVIIDVNRLLLFEHPINPYFDHYLYHICSVGNSRTDFNNPSKRNKTDFLTNYLLKFYPPLYPVYMLQSGTLSTPVIRESSVENLTGFLDSVNFDCSLFIPGKKNELPKNKDFLDIIKENNN